MFPSIYIYCFNFYPHTLNFYIFSSIKISNIRAEIYTIMWYIQLLINTPLNIAHTRLSRNGGWFWRVSPVQLHYYALSTLFYVQNYFRFAGHIQRNLFDFFVQFFNVISFRIYFNILNWKFLMNNYFEGLGCNIFGNFDCN